MPQVSLIVTHPAGLHARPAALFVQTAQRFRCVVHVRHDERRANAKSILGVLALGAGLGAQVTVEAQGEDADEALTALQALVESDFGEAET